MSSDDPVLELVARGLFLREEGRPEPPEKLCAARPDLLEAVRAGLEAVANAEAGCVGGPEPLPAVPGYEVIRPLGEGGMGVVYEARCLQLERRVAVKMILGGPAARPKDRERFLGEAQAAAKLAHPNVVCVHGWGHAGRVPFVAFEYVLSSDDYFSPTCCLTGKCYHAARCIPQGLSSV